MNDETILIYHEGNEIASKKLLATARGGQGESTENLLHLRKIGGIPQGIGIVEIKPVRRPEPDDADELFRLVMLTERGIDPIGGLGPPEHRLAAFLNHLGRPLLAGKALPGKARRGGNRLLSGRSLSLAQGTEIDRQKGPAGRVDDVSLIGGQPFPGGPASSAGIRPGDVLVEVDGVSVVGMPIDEVVSLVRGPAGTTVSLVLERAGVDAVEVEVVREALELSTARFTIHPGGIGYLSVSSFEGRTPDEVEDQLQQLLLRDIRALILDLRGNPGGRPSAALAIADHFLDGEVVYLEEGLDGTSTPHRAGEGGLATDIPVAILIDQGTAGEAEMLAAALRTHQRGPLLGLRTGGRSALHRGWEVGDGVVVVVRSGRWLTPNRGDVDPGGLPPDQEVGLSAEDVATGFDRPQATANAYLWTLLEGGLGEPEG